ncbi:hypothetical protein DFH09DRAFT_1332839 [Mycena vulgaris]|nr:hypothetical protein DFH09DRAFT_1332839 [Mycena vulgaris]
MSLATTRVDLVPDNVARILVALERGFKRRDCRQLDSGHAFLVQLLREYRFATNKPAEDAYDAYLTSQLLDPSAARALAISPPSRFAFPAPTSRALRVSPTERPAHPNATSPFAQRPFPPRPRAPPLRARDRPPHPSATAPARAFPASTSRAQRATPADRRLQRDERSAQARGLAASSAVHRPRGLFVRDSRAAAASSPRVLLAQNAHADLRSRALPPPRRTRSVLRIRSRSSGASTSSRPRTSSRERRRARTAAAAQDTRDSRAAPFSPRTPKCAAAPRCTLHRLARVVRSSPAAEAQNERRPAPQGATRAPSVGSAHRICTTPPFPHAPVHAVNTARRPQRRRHCCDRRRASFAHMPPYSFGARARVTASSALLIRASARPCYEHGTSAPAPRTTRTMPPPHPIVAS